VQIDSRTKTVFDNAASLEAHLGEEPGGVLAGVDNRDQYFPSTRLRLPLPTYAKRAAAGDDFFDYKIDRADVQERLVLRPK